MRFFTIMGSWLENGDCALQHFNEWLPVRLQRMHVIVNPDMHFGSGPTCPDPTQPGPARPIRPEPT